MTKVFETRTERLARLDASIAEWYEIGGLSIERVSRISRLARTCGTTVEARAAELGLR